MKMKSIDLFCASPASTAICSSMDQRAIVRPIDRQIHRLGRTPRARPSSAPCSSELPFDPSRPFRKPTSAKQTEILRRKSSADVDDLSRSPPGSSRYLLSDKPFYDIMPKYERGPASSQALVVRDNYSNKNYERSNDQDGFQGFRSLSANSSYESPVYKPSWVGSENVQAQRYSPGKLKAHLNAQKSPPDSSKHQVVELRVSIHCKGCEGKLRKYISKMEGVTSFSIDLATKKVKVIGDVTPLGVLTSISKVKNAQFWPSPTTSSSPRVSLAR